MYYAELSLAVTARAAHHYAPSRPAVKPSLQVHRRRVPVARTCRVAPAAGQSQSDRDSPASARATVTVIH